MKTISLAFIILLVSFTSFSQSLKRFNGQFYHGVDLLPSGNASYTYYIDTLTGEEVKQGSFKYVYRGENAFLGFNQTITGTFDKGLKTGLWTFLTTSTDVGSENPYTTGTETLIANYKDGHANGNWKYIQNTKTRRKMSNSGGNKWSAYSIPAIASISMNFNMDTLVGLCSLDHSSIKYKVSGSFDKHGFCTGTWIINDRKNNNNKTLQYKDRFLYDCVTKNNSGKIDEALNVPERKDDYKTLISLKSMSQKQKDESEYRIDTANYSEPHSAIEPYIEDLFKNDQCYYQAIGGDLTFLYGVVYGRELRVVAKNP